MPIWCLSGIPWFPCLTGAFPLPDKVLKAVVLGVVGLFRPPAVPGVLGASIISHGAWPDSLSEVLEPWADRGCLLDQRVTKVRINCVVNSALRQLEQVDSDWQGPTHTIRIVTAKAALACLQYPMRSELTGGPHFLVMYQGAPGWGCAGSLMSGPAWLWMLIAKRMTSAVWARRDTKGWKTDVMNMIPLQRRMKTERTEITTL